MSERLTTTGRRPGSRLGPWILVLLVLIPLVEIAVLIAVGKAIGGGWALLLMLATSILGGYLLRHQGAKAWRAVKADVDAGRPPGKSAVDGLLVVIGGIFMLVPGFVSDVIGLLLILPPTRALFRGLAVASLVRRAGPRATTDMFGPRRVRADTGTPRPTDPLEGEVIDPRP